MPTDRDGSSSPLQVGLVQLNPRKADVRGNLGRILEWTARAGPHHDLLVFPEVSLSGYFLEGGVAEVATTVEDVALRLGSPPTTGRTWCWGSMSGGVEGSTTA